MGLPSPQVTVTAPWHIGSGPGPDRVPHRAGTAMNEGHQLGGLAVAANDGHPISSMIGLVTNLSPMERQPMQTTPQPSACADLGLWVWINVKSRIPDLTHAHPS